MNYPIKPEVECSYFNFVFNLMKIYFFLILAPKLGICVSLHSLYRPEKKRGKEAWHPYLLNLQCGKAAQHITKSEEDETMGERTRERWRERKSEVAAAAAAQPGLLISCYDTTCLKALLIQFSVAEQCAGWQ